MKILQKEWDVEGIRRKKKVKRERERVWGGGREGYIKAAQKKFKFKFKF
jgi:hypothetical protein